MKKLTLITGLAVGYVLGTRDGRERYEQIKSRATQLWNDPQVREKAGAAQDLVKEKAPEMKSRAADVADKAASAVHRGSSDDDTVTTASGSSA